MMAARGPSPAFRARRRAQRLQRKLEVMRARHARPRAIRRQTERVVKVESLARKLEAA